MFTPFNPMKKSWMHFWALVQVLYRKKNCIWKITEEKLLRELGLENMSPPPSSRQEVQRNDWVHLHFCCTSQWGGYHHQKTFPPLWLFHSWSPVLRKLFTAFKERTLSGERGTSSRQSLLSWEDSLVSLDKFICCGIEVVIMVTLLPLK